MTSWLDASGSPGTTRVGAVPQQPQGIAQTPPPDTGYITTVTGYHGGHWRGQCAAPVGGNGDRTRGRGREGYGRWSRVPWETEAWACENGCRWRAHHLFHGSVVSRGCLGEQRANIRRFMRWMAAVLLGIRTTVSLKSPCQLCVCVRSQLNYFLLCM